MPSDALYIRTGVRLGGSRRIVAALDAVLLAERPTPDVIERHTHPRWEAGRLEAYAAAPVPQDAEAVGLARLYGPRDGPCGPDTWTVAAPWYGRLPGFYAGRATALIAYGYVLGGEQPGPLEDLRHRVNRLERRAIDAADLSRFADYRDRTAR